jgi:hypothetical protein
MTSSRARVPAGGRPPPPIPATKPELSLGTRPCQLRRRTAGRLVKIDHRSSEFFNQQNLGCSYYTAFCIAAFMSSEANQLKAKSLVICRPVREQIRAGDQPQNRQVPRPRSATSTARPRRRGDRISALRCCDCSQPLLAHVWPVRRCPLVGGEADESGVASKGRLLTPKRSLGAIEISQRSSLL